jgi:hypothetical protein
VHFFAILLYCVIPVIRRFSVFRSLSALNRLLRLAFTICLSMKFLCHTTSLLLARLAPGETVFLMGGIVLLELPCYFTATCFSLVLMFWLYVCAEIVPTKYAARFKVMRVILIGFNVIVYLLFTTGAIFAGIHGNASNSFAPTFLGWSAIGRDFVLGIVFVMFVVNLRTGLNEYAGTGETVDERRLMKFTIVLSVCVLLRGTVTLVQGVFLSEQPSECSAGFLIAFTLSEMVFEGGPFIFLVRVNNDFLGEDDQSDRSLGVNSTVFDGLTG